ERMYGQKPDELFRVRLHEGRRVVIDPRGFINELSVVRHIAPRIRRDIENDRPVDHLHRTHMIVPRMRGRNRLVGTPFAIERGARGFRGNPVAGSMTVNIDDHLRNRAPRSATPTRMRTGLSLLRQPWPAAP